MAAQLGVTQYTQQNEYKKPSTGAKIGGVLVGSLVGGAVSTPLKSFSPKAIEEMTKLSKGLSQDEVVKVTGALEDNLKKTGLLEKGVEIVKASKNNSDKVQEIMAKEIEKGIVKYYPKQLKDVQISSTVEQLIAGNNAFYAMKSKKIMLPENALCLSGFHEMGHALNANMSKIGKILQKTRGLQMLSLPILLVALFKTKKAPDEKPKNGLDKATTFIKNNAGKLTFAAFLPALLEEGLATMKGNKIAKEALSSDLAKKVAKSNMWGFSTYLLLASLSAVGVWAANKVKDKIAGPKLVQKNTAQV